MKSKKSRKENRHGSLKRDHLLLTLAKTGDVAISALCGKYESGESGLFSGMSEMRVYIARLKRQGLVIQKKRGYATITEKGLQKVTQSMNMPSYARRYEMSKKAPHVLTMIIFDVPERENQKRDWLRFQLKSLDFKYVQGSAWLGQHPLPDALLHDLKQYGMLRYVHIFSINRSGTMSDLLDHFGF